MSDRTLGILHSRRFLPLFVTQFLGAFNDNIFKNALLVLIAFSMNEGDADLLINLAAGLFILPFFLFSATAGQIADRFDKSRLIRMVKMAEVGKPGSTTTGLRPAAARQMGLPGFSATP